MTEHQTIVSERGTVHYWLERCQKENATCLVFTHGLTADHTMFEQQTEHFKNDFTILLWDVPLHGLSRPYSNFTYENAAIELNSILDAENIGQCVLIGMSMGGYPSQMFASLYPQKVLGFIGIDTTPFGTAYYSKSDLFWLKAAAPCANLFSDKLLRESMAKSVSATAYSYRKMLAMLSPLSKADIIAQMDAAYGIFASENKDILLSCPVLLILGEKDKTGKVSVYNKKWSKRTGFPLCTIPNAAHFSNGDNPNAVNHAIDNFFKNSVL